MTHSYAARRTPIVAAAALLATAFALAGCAPTTDTASPATTSPAAVSEVLAAHELAGLDTAEVIERLDAMPVADRPTDLIASVRPDALILTDTDKRETRLAMPDDEVYVSIAPYREQTHECYFHSLTTCLGELRNTEVKVTLTAADGTVLVSGMQQTYDNGFFGIWVPRGIEATLDIEYEGTSGTGTISTMNDDDATCLTTLQLT